MKKMSKNVLLCALLCLLSSSLAAQTTYMLQQVTAVEAEGLYVFEQRGYVMSNAVNGSNALLTTTDFSSYGLTGTEPYVWKLERASGGYYLRNVSLGSKCYLTYSGSSTGVILSAKNDYSVWTFDFQEDGTVLIKNGKASGRYLGFVDQGTNYKAYATSDMTYEHAIKVFRLVEDDGGSPVVVDVPTFSVEAGTVDVGTEVILTSGGTTLLYTLDGSDPATSSTAIASEGSTATVRIEETTIVKAVSVDADGHRSEVVTMKYSVPSSELIDLCEGSGMLVFEDFAGLPSSYSNRESEVELKGSDGKLYAWRVKNVLVDNEGLLQMKGGEGSVVSWPVRSEHGFMVQAMYEVFSTATISLAVTGAETVTQTSSYTDGETQVIEAWTRETADAVVTLASDNHSISVLRLTFLATDEDGVPTGMSKVVEGNNREASVFYNMAGQRVAHPTKGLYVVGGKKVWIGEK